MIYRVSAQASRHTRLTSPPPTARSRYLTALALAVSMLCCHLAADAAARQLQVTARAPASSPLMVAGVRVAYEGVRASRQLPRCTPPDVRHLPRAMAAIRDFSSRYNERAMSLLDTVVLCGRLGDGEDAWIRGLYDPQKRMILVELDHHDDTVYVLHHEFSSLLMAASGDLSGFRRRWVQHNRGTYNAAYGDSSAQPWRVDWTLYRRGFLHPYGQTSFENDLNIIAGFVMSSYLHERLRQASLAPAIRAKVTLAHDFMRPWLKSPAAVARVIGV